MTRHLLPDLTTGPPMRTHRDSREHAVSTRSPLCQTTRLVVSACRDFLTPHQRTAPSRDRLAQTAGPVVRACPGFPARSGVSWA